jgi:tetratricopeptide (TPR) repeat protein
MAEALKVEGNKAFSAKDYDLAIDLFSKALDLDENNFVLWSNRSAAKAGKRDWDGALDDAEQVCYHFTTRCPRSTTENTPLLPIFRT